MIQQTVRQYTAIAKLALAVVTSQLEEALTSIEKRPTQEEMVSIIPGVPGQIRGLLDSDRETLVNAVMKSLKPINTGYDRMYLCQWASK